MDPNLLLRAFDYYIQTHLNGCLTITKVLRFHSINRDFYDWQLNSAKSVSDIEAHLFGIHYVYCWILVNSISQPF